MCYAYRDENYKEYLVDHLINVVKCCENRWEFNAIAKKISKTLNIPEENVKNTIILAALLHDIGKTAQIFQEQCDENQNNKTINTVQLGVERKCTTFPGHYLISLFLVKLTYETLGSQLTIKDAVDFLSNSDMMKIEKNKAKIIELLVILPIVFHHYHQVEDFISYAAKYYYDIKDLVKSSILQFIENPKIHRKCIEQINKLSEELRKSSNHQILMVINTLHKVLSEIESYEHSEMHSNLYRRSEIFVKNLFNEVIKKDVKSLSISLPKIAIESIIGLINLCDGYVAHKSRSGKGEFVK